MSRAAPQSLDILRASPVRGQLESYDPRTPKGTRYIQTTDTPDELKVLLPPGTATMYEQLLKLENYELGKKPSVSWERIMEIRRLKDRMIRKCQKLAKTSMPVAKTSSRADAFVFQTFVAPSDFRSKEMEKWFREQQRRGSSMARAIPGGSFGDYDLVTAGPSIRRISSSKQLMKRSITNPEPSSAQKQLNKPIPAILGVQPIQPERTTSLPEGPSNGSLFSPPPLPVLLLSQRDDYNPPSLGSAGEQLGPAAAPPPPAVVPGSSSTPVIPPVPDAVSPSISNNPEGAPSTLRPSLSRRSSGGVKRNSVDLKTVSWADNKIDLDQQFSKYASAASEAQASGKWDEVRVLYLAQIAGLESLHTQVKEGLEHLRVETDHLQRIDETIRRQRGTLDATFQEFEQKQTLFQEKVQEALREANEALARQGVKRDLEPITELSSS